MFDHILFVCVGNICRSPMAEYVFKQNMPDKTISSAGLGALIGHAADPLAIKVLQEQKNIDADAHRARQLDDNMIREADLVLVMEHWQRQKINQLYPYARGKVMCLGHWENFEIPDPYQKPEQAFLYTLELIENGLTLWQQKL